MSSPLSLYHADDPAHSPESDLDEGSRPCPLPPRAFPRTSLGSPKVVTLIRQAEVAYNDGRYRVVCRLMEENLQRHPDHVPSLLWLAAALRKQRLFEDAKKVGLRVLHHPSATKAQRLKAKLCLGYCRLEHYRDQGYESDFREAEDWLTQATRERSLLAHCGLVFLYCARVRRERHKHPELWDAANNALMRAQGIDLHAAKTREALRVFRNTFDVR